MTITLQAVNELIQSLESAGELSIKETKVMALARAYQQLAAESVGLRNSSSHVLQRGEPPKTYRDEWFIAKLKNGEYAALKALPAAYSYDYRTNDGTYYTKDWVVGWMQTPDTEYRPNVKTPATDSIVAGIKADEAKFIFHSILDNPAVTDLGSLVDWLEQHANDSAAAVQAMREGADKC